MNDGGDMTHHGGVTAGGCHLIPDLIGAGVFDLGNVIIREGKAACVHAVADHRPGGGGGDRRGQAVLLLAVVGTVQSSGRGIVDPGGCNGQGVAVLPALIVVIGVAGGGDGHRAVLLDRDLAVGVYRGHRVVAALEGNGSVIVAGEPKGIFIGRSLVLREYDGRTCVGEAFLVLQDVLGDGHEYSTVGIAVVAGAVGDLPVHGVVPRISACDLGKVALPAGVVRAVLDRQARRQAAVQGHQLLALAVVGQIAGGKVGLIAAGTAHVDGVGHGNRNGVEVLGLAHRQGNGGRGIGGDQGHRAGLLIHAYGRGVVGGIVGRRRDVGQIVLVHNFRIGVHTGVGEGHRVGHGTAEVGIEYLAVEGGLQIGLADGIGSLGAVTAERGLAHHGHIIVGCHSGIPGLFGNGIGPRVAALDGGGLQGDAQILAVGHSAAGHRPGQPDDILPVEAALVVDGHSHRPLVHGVGALGEGDIIVAVFARRAGNIVLAHRALFVSVGGEQAAEQIRAIAAHHTLILCGDGGVGQCHAAQIRRIAIEALGVADFNGDRTVGDLKPALYKSHSVVGVACRAADVVGTHILGIVRDAQPDSQIVVVVHGAAAHSPLVLLDGGLTAVIHGGLVLDGHFDRRFGNGGVDLFLHGRGRVHRPGVRDLDRIVLQLRAAFSGEGVGDGDRPCVVHRGSVIYRTGEDGGDILVVLLAGQFHVGDLTGRLRRAVVGLGGGHIPGEGQLRLCDLNGEAARHVVVVLRVYQVVHRVAARIGIAGHCRAAAIGGGVQLVSVVRPGRGVINGVVPIGQGRTAHLDHHAAGSIMGQSVIGIAVGVGLHRQGHLSVRGDDQLSSGLGAGVVAVDRGILIDHGLYPVSAHTAGRAAEGIRALLVGVEGVDNVCGCGGVIARFHAVDRCGIDGAFHLVAGVGCGNRTVLSVGKIQRDRLGRNGQLGGDGPAHLIVAGVRVLACCQGHITGGKGYPCSRGHVLAVRRTGLARPDGGGQALARHSTGHRTAVDAACAHSEGGRAVVGHGLIGYSDGDRLCGDGSGHLDGDRIGAIAQLSSPVGVVGQVSPGQFVPDGDGICVRHILAVVGRAVHFGRDGFTRGLSGHIGGSDVFSLEISCAVVDFSLGREGRCNRQRQPGDVNLHGAGLVGVVGRADLIPVGAAVRRVLDGGTHVGGPVGGLSIALDEHDGISSHVGTAHAGDGGNEIRQVMIPAVIESGIVLGDHRQVRGADGDGEGHRLHVIVLILVFCRLCQRGGDGIGALIAGNSGGGRFAALLEGVGDVIGGVEVHAVVAGQTRGSDLVILGGQRLPGVGGGGLRRCGQGHRCFADIHGDRFHGGDVVVPRFVAVKLDLTGGNGDLLAVSGVDIRKGTDGIGLQGELNVALVRVEHAAAGQGRSGQLHRGGAVIYPVRGGDAAGDSDGPGGDLAGGFRQSQLALGKRHVLIAVVAPLGHIGEGEGEGDYLVVIGVLIVVGASGGDADGLTLNAGIHSNAGEHGGDGIVSVVHLLKAVGYAAHSQRLRGNLYGEAADGGVVVIRFHLVPVIHGAAAAVGHILHLEAVLPFVGCRVGSCIRTCYRKVSLIATDCTGAGNAGYRGRVVAVTVIGTDIACDVYRQILCGDGDLSCLGIILVVGIAGQTCLQPIGPYLGRRSTHRIAAGLPIIVLEKSVGDLTGVHRSCSVARVGHRGLLIVCDRRAGVAKALVIQGQVCVRLVDHQLIADAGLAHVCRLRSFDRHGGRTGLQQGHLSVVFHRDHIGFRGSGVFFLRGLIGNGDIAAVQRGRTGDGKGRVAQGLGDLIGAGCIVICIPVRTALRRQGNGLVGFPDRQGIGGIGSGIVVALRAGSQLGRDLIDTYIFKGEVRGIIDRSGCSKFLFFSGLVLIAVRNGVEGGGVLPLVGSHQSVHCSQLQRSAVGGIGGRLGLIIKFQRGCGFVNGKGLSGVAYDLVIVRL